VENRLSVVTNTVTGEVTRFTYDGDGKRTLREDGSGVTVYLGPVEVHITGTERVTRTYYHAGDQRIAMSVSGSGGGELTYLHGDHLGSASLATDASGALLNEMRYTPYGVTRSGDMPTDRRYTDQRWESGLGLYDYGARFYSAALGRFVSADSIVPSPGNPQSFNRYAYVLNNPLHYVDPSGHIQNNPNELLRADNILNTLTNDYDVKIRKDWGWKGLPWARKWNAGAWTIDELETILQEVTGLATAMGGSRSFRDTFGGVRIHRKDMNNPGEANAHDVWLSTTAWNNTDPWTVVHELAHAWDAAHGWQLSKDMQSAMGAGFAHPIRHFFDRSNPAYWYDPGNGPPPCGIDGNFNRKEDFAEAVTAYIDATEAQMRANGRGWPYADPVRGYIYADFYATPRGQHIQALMVTPP